MRFKEFILNESQAYLAQKVGDILTAAQELRDDSKNMGSRDLVRFSERIVNQIRRVLHSNWPREEKKHLITLQKVGVALMKSIEDKDDLSGTISGSTEALEKLVSDLGVPIHKMATTDAAPETESKTGTDSAVQTQSPQNKNTQAQTQPQDATPDQAAPPQNPQDMERSEPVGPPGGMSAQDLYTPPLGGNSGSRLDAF
jgi:hypothetical protein